jgi:hypothetical protein
MTRRSSGSLRTELRFGASSRVALGQARQSVGIVISMCCRHRYRLSDDASSIQPSPLQAERQITLRGLATGRIIALVSLLIRLPLQEEL